VLRPIAREIYEPILRELETFGINFKENFTDYLGYNPDNIGG
jgi:saccharopine dehydrogenase (NAD+, L-glutamate forming)